MATIQLKDGSEYLLKLAALESGVDDLVKRAIYDGTAILADDIKKRISALPEDEYRHLGESETFDVISPEQKRDLLESFGVTPIRRDNDNNYNAKIGFDGYGHFPTKKYPRGLPNQLLARAIESGSSVRQKRPFVRPAVSALRKRVKDAMGETIEQGCAQIIGK